MMSLCVMCLSFFSCCSISIIFSKYKINSNQITYIYMWVTRRKDMIRMKLLTGVIQREPLKTVDTGVKREDGSPLEEIDHTPRIIETAEQNLERQVNEWYDENIVAQDQVLERVHYFAVLPGGIVHFLAIHYDDGIGSEVKVVK